MHGKLFNCWSKAQVFNSFFDIFKDDVELDFLIVDSSYVKVHKHGTNSKDSQKKESISCSVGRITTKIHVVANSLGTPLDIVLSCGNKHDSTIGYSLLEKIENSIILADKVYNSKKIRAKLTENNSKLVSSPKKNALNPIDYDKHLYKECHIVKCYFQK